MKTWQLREDQRREAFLLRESGLTLEEIGKTFGVTKVAISNLLAWSPSERKMKDSEINATEQRRAAKKMRRDGMLLKNIASELGVSVQRAFQLCLDPEEQKKRQDEANIRRKSK